MNGHDGTSAEALRRAGLHIPEPDHPLVAEQKAATEAELAKRGERLGLSAAQVDAADRNGMDLARYKAMLDVRNVDDFTEAMERVADEAEARRQLRVDRLKRELA